MSPEDQAALEERAASNREYEVDRATQALEAYMGAPLYVADESNVRDLISALEHLADHLGLGTINTHSAHVAFLAETGRCLNCGENPDSAAQQDEVWNETECPASEHYSGDVGGPHKFDDLAAASQLAIARAEQHGIAPQNSVGR